MGFQRRRRRFIRSGMFGFNPAALFAQGQQGAWYLAQPTYQGQQILFQDAAGTAPVVDDGDPVGLMLDLSPNDNHATQSVSADRPIYHTDGTLHWLSFNGVSQYLACGSYSFAGAFAVSVAARVNNPDGEFPRLLSKWDGLDGDWILGPASLTDPQFAGRFLVQKLGGTHSSSQNGMIGQDHIHYGSLDSNLIFALDGETGTAGVSAPIGTSPTEIRLGSDAGGASDRFLNGRMYGAILTEFSAGAEPQDEIQNYLANLAGVSL